MGRKIRCDSLHLRLSARKKADLFAEGMRRYCKHSKLQYLDMLCEHHAGYQTVFLDEDKIAHARAFADRMLEEMSAVGEG